MPDHGPNPTKGPFRLGYRPALDGLRAVAVVLVMLHHTGAFLWPSLSGDLATGGFLGVDVFFVLSGFLITLILLTGEPTRLGPFFLRRIRRLVPALLVLLVFLAGCALVFHSPTRSVLLATAGWVLSYTGNWVLSSRPFAPEVAHTWSLAIEGQFYLLWPVVTLVVLRFARGSRVALAAVAAVGILAVMAWRAHVWQTEHNWLALYIRTPARFDSLLVGCLAGLAASSGWLSGQAHRRWEIAMGAGLLVLIALAFFVDGPTGALYQGGLTAIAVVAALVVLGTLFARPSFPVVRLLGSRPFVAVGRWSYSLYLWHFPLFYLLREHQPDWSPVVRTAVGWVLAFGVAVASYRFVESPFLRRSRKIMPPLPDVASV